LTLVVVNIVHVVLCTYSYLSNSGFKQHPFSDQPDRLASAQPAVLISFSCFLRDMIASHRNSEKRAICKVTASKRAKAAMCKFVSDHPAMALGPWLVIADLHLGITRELYEAGFSLPSQVKPFVKRLHDLKRLTHTSKLILLGDVKHKVPGVSWQEEQELPEFLAALEFDEIVIIKGNHDGSIERMIPHELRNKVKIRDGLAICGCYFTHGHRKITSLRSLRKASLFESPEMRSISACKRALRSMARSASSNVKTIIIGHNQPAIMFQDAIGARYIEPVWVRGPLNGAYKGHELVVMPAFNELRGHVLVNKQKLIGPVAKHITPKTARAFLLDGTDLGTLADLKLKED